MSHLSDQFFADLAALGDRRGSDPAIFLVVWCVESNLNPAAMNSIGARGLNQFLPSTLASLGAPADFEKLSGEKQLPWIEKFIANGEHRNGGPFQTAARYYHSNFFPVTMSRGDSPDTVVAARDAADPRERDAYTANPALDADHDGKITLADLSTVLERTRANKCQEAFVRLAEAVSALEAQSALPASWQDPPTSLARAETAIGAGLLTGALALTLLRRRRAT
ncbi:MAG TPA: transglycosylase SLT domain-containing protein [Polyangiaceae bacterium]